MTNRTNERLLHARVGDPRRKFSWRRDPDLLQGCVVYHLRCTSPGGIELGISVACSHGEIRTPRIAALRLRYNRALLRRERSVVDRSPVPLEGT